MEEELTIHIPGEIRQMLNRTQEELGRDMRLYTAMCYDVLLCTFALCVCRTSANYGILLCIGTPATEIR